MEKLVFSSVCQFDYYCMGWIGFPYSSRSISLCCQQQHNFIFGIKESYLNVYDVGM